MIKTWCCHTDPADSRKIEVKCNTVVSVWFRQARTVRGIEEEIIGECRNAGMVWHFGCGVKGAK